MNPLRSIDPISPPVYPVPTEERLTAHFFTQFHHDRYLNSRLHLRASIGVRGAAMELFMISRRQSPVGTLPTDHAEISALLRVTPGVFSDLMAEDITPLHNWSPCISDRGEMRLMHETVLEVVQDAVGSRERTKEAQEAGRVRQRLSRLRDAVEKQFGPRKAADDALIERVDDWLERYGPGRRTAEAVKRAVEADAMRDARQSYEV